MFGTPAAISREYMIPFSHREGGYAIAANMHGGGPPGSRAGSIDYGRQMRYNRYSTESGMDDVSSYPTSGVFPECSYLQQLVISVRHV